VYRGRLARGSNKTALGCSMLGSDGDGAPADAAFLTLRLDGFCDFGPAGAVAGGR